MGVAPIGIRFVLGLPENTGVAIYSITVLANGFPLVLRRRAPIIQEPEIVLQFGPVARRRKRYTDVLVRQTKPVAIARRGRLMPRRIVRRGSEKRAPSQSRKRDHWHLAL